jgi:hypothetical protein
MIKMNADAIDEALLNDSNEDDEFEYEDDDDCEIEQVQNSIKDSKKTLLH